MLAWPGCQSSRTSVQEEGGVRVKVADLGSGLVSWATEAGKVYSVREVSDSGAFKT